MTDPNLPRVEISHHLDSCHCSLCRDEHGNHVPTYSAYFELSDVPGPFRRTIAQMLGMMMIEREMDRRSTQPPEPPQ